MNARLGALILACCLMLTGCADKTIRKTPEPETMLGQAAELDESAVLLTVNGREIPVWRYLYWLARACERVQARYGTDNAVMDWEQTVEGRPLREYVKEQALMDTALYSVTESMAAEFALTLSDADRQILAEQWQTRCDARGGETAYLRELSRYGLDRARELELLQAGLLYSRLHALWQSGTGPVPDEAELDAIARENNSIRADRILLSGENRDAARRKAESFFSQLNGAENQEELFYELEEQGDDHGGPRTPDQWDEKLSQVARALNIGQVSGIIETDEGFSILRRLPPDRTELLKTWLDRRLEQLAEAADIEVTKRWRSLDAVSFADALERLQQPL